MGKDEGPGTLRGSTLLPPFFTGGASLPCFVRGDGAAYLSSCSTRGSKGVFTER